VHTLWAIRRPNLSAARTGETGDFRISGLQTCLWDGSKRAICSDSHSQPQELSEVPGANTGVDLSAQTLEKMGATGTSDEDATWLLSVLWAAPLRAQAQLGTAASTAPVDMRLESSRATAPDELDAAEELPVVPTAVCSKPTPYDLNAAYIRQCHLGSPVRENCTPGSAWGDENKRPCLLGEASARKRLRPQGSAQAKVIKTRLYQPRSARPPLFAVMAGGNRTILVMRAWASRSRWPFCREKPEQVQIHLFGLLLLHPMACARNEGLRGEPRHRLFEQIEIAAVHADDRIFLTHEKRRWLHDRRPGKECQQFAVAVHVAVPIQAARESGPCELAGKELKFLVAEPSRESIHLGERIQQ